MKLRLLPATAAVLLAASLQAQTVYRWTDDEGLVHYGHSVPPEHRARGYDRLGRDGSVVERIEPEMSAEERARRTAQLALQAQLEAEQENQAARDRLLLAAYRNEQDLLNNLDWRLENLGNQRSALETSLEHSRRRFENLVSQAATQRRRDEPVSGSVEDSIAETRAEIRRLQQAIDELDERKAETSARFQADLERFRAARSARD